MFNQITVVGNICQDIKLSKTKSDVACSSNTIASSHKYLVNGVINEEVCYLDFVVFGKIAENMNQYLHKGSKVFLQGRMVQKKYVDQEGKNRNKYEIVVETMKFLDNKPADNNQSGNPCKNVQASPDSVQTESVQQQTPEVNKPAQEGEGFPY
ncbi:single-stranded DNA-binding protein [Campylobacter sp. TTU-622]|uniref:single-stranded DNA-binding protein n=1 Tax=Campylobacter sp. TTU-622 TaxID=2800583 RepID=UPI00190684B5|nr:single-stranded DNA-binding protein [Campylobacter sp. TTU-622]MBK1973040.1 single-stranded DNA-binding protein [Campylobacter sp. TTU-622]